jgi:hypothetical protein
MSLDSGREAINARNKTQTTRVRHLSIGLGRAPCGDRRKRRKKKKDGEMQSHGFRNSAPAASIVLLAVAAAQGDTSPSPKPGAFSGVQMAAQGCGHNYYRAPNGSCDIVRNPNRDCPDGFHSVPAPTPSGYRCVQDGY